MAQYGSFPQYRAQKSRALIKRTPKKAPRCSSTPAAPPEPGHSWLGGGPAQPGGAPDALTSLRASQNIPYAGPFGRIQKVHLPLGSAIYTTGPDFRIGGSTFFILLGPIFRGLRSLRYVLSEGVFGSFGILASPLGGPGLRTGAVVSRATTATIAEGRVTMAVEGYLCL